MQRSEDIMLDDQAVARALKAPKAPQFSSGLRTKYRLEDRLPGVGTIGSMMPPASERQLEAMRGTLAPPVKGSSSRALLLGLVLTVLATATGAIVYRDMNRTPAPVSAETVSQ